MNILLIIFIMIVPSCAHRYNFMRPENVELNMLQEKI